MRHHVIVPIMFAGMAVLYYLLTAEVLAMVTGMLLAFSMFFEGIWKNARRITIVLTVGVIGVCIKYFWFSLVPNLEDGVVVQMLVTVLYMFVVFLNAVVSFK